MGDEVAHKVANATGWDEEGAHTHSGGPVPAHHVSTKEPKGAALLPAFCSARLVLHRAYRNARKERS